MSSGLPIALTVRDRYAKNIFFSVTIIPFVPPSVALSPSLNKHNKYLRPACALRFRRSVTHVVRKMSSEQHNVPSVSATVAPAPVLPVVSIRTPSIDPGNVISGKRNRRPPARFTFGDVVQFEDDSAGDSSEEGTPGSDTDLVSSSDSEWVPEPPVNTDPFVTWDYADESEEDISTSEEEYDSSSSDKDPAGGSRYADSD